MLRVPHQSPTILPPQHRPATEDEARAHLEARKAYYQAAAARLDGRSRLLARGRLVAVGLVLIGLVVAINGRGAMPAWWASPVAAAFLVGVLIVRHARVDEARRHALTLGAFHRHARARLDRQWREAPAPETFLPPNATATDLDITGPASLLHLIGRAATAGGQRRLEAWALASTFERSTTLARQGAVRELTSAIAFREAFVATGRLQPADARRIEAFTQWLAGGELPGKAWAPWALWALTLASGGSFLAAALGGMSFAVWPMPLFVGWGVTLALARHVAAAFAGAGALSYGLGQFVALVRLIEDRPSSEPLLMSTRAKLAVSDRPASEALRHLDRLVGFSQFRHGALLHVVVHSLTWWDLHVWLALLRWRHRHGAAVAQWLDAVATYDALVQLAGLAYLHPQWAFPEIEEGELRVVGRAVGHPLLPTAVRVPNDVDIGPPGTVLVITGSNMAGKSTLLRAVGLNVVLSRLGAPVCAQAFTLPSLRLETCMRTVDSLEQGLSSFMAQLTRLKAVVDAAAVPDPPLLYLLDEVLHGTNSEERRVAVQRIVGHLLRARAIGGITTHDLALTQIPSLSAAACHVHFSEVFDDSVSPPTMRFDYVMRRGPATSSNALKLVQMMGLPEA